MQLFCFFTTQDHLSFHFPPPLPLLIWRIRCFSFGIGSGASTHLVKGIAEAGLGTAEFITGGERMQPKVCVHSTWVFTCTLLICTYVCTCMTLCMCILGCMCKGSVKPLGKYCPVNHEWTK